MPVEGPTARELMTPRPITVSTDAPVSRALGVMREHSIHEVPVLRNGRLAGMVTFDSLARRINLPLSTKVEHLLVLPPLISPATGYSELAEQLLAAGLRAAPVVGKKGELLGIVSRTDLVRAFPKIPEISEHLVEEVSSTAGLLVKETDTCGSLVHHVRILEEHPLPVVDRRGRLVGAVGIEDLGRVLWRPTTGGKKDAARRGSALDVEVGSFMNTPPLTVPHGTRTGAAAEKMTRQRVSSVFVVDASGTPTGVVSQVDLLGLAVGTDAESTSTIEDVYVQIHGLRGSGDPSTLTEIDRLVAKSLRHISRNSRPILLSIHVHPQGTHRSGDATVQARLHTDGGMFHASETGWNFFAAVQQTLDDLVAQTRRVRDDRRAARRANRKALPETEEPIVDGELEEKLRSMRGLD